MWDIKEGIVELRIDIYNIDYDVRQIVAENNFLQPKSDELKAIENLTNQMLLNFSSIQRKIDSLKKELKFHADWREYIKVCWLYCDI